MLTIEEIKKLLRHSADMQFYKGNMILMTVMIAGFALLSAVCAVATGDPVFWLVSLPSLLIGVPVLVWDIFNVCHIFKNIGDYRFFETTLTHAQSTWGRRMYFMITVEGREVETRAIFNAYGIMAPQFNEYSNAQALVGYNTATDEVVITERK